MNTAPTGLLQRLSFDTAAGQVLDQDRRYLLMRADVLMGMFAALPAAQRLQAMAALTQSVWQHGANSVRAYASQPGGTQQVLLISMQDSAASLGWGRWQFDAVAQGLRLTVSNSPFATMASFNDQPACGAIVGMLKALGEALWSGSVDAWESQCSAMHGHESHVCHFELRSQQP